MGRQLLRLLLRGGLLTALCSVGYVCLVGADVFAQRHLRFAAGDAIADRMVPGDTEVTIDYDGDPPLSVGAPPGMSTTQWLAQLYPVIVLLDVDQLTPALTTSGDWIQTSVSGTIADVLRSANSNLQPGSQVSFLLDGGAMVVRGVPVRAFKPWIRPVAQGNRYLVFARTDAEGHFQTWQSAMFEVSQGTMKRVDNGSPAPGVENRQIGDVLQEVRGLQ